MGVRWLQEPNQVQKTEKMVLRCCRMCRRLEHTGVLIITINGCVKWEERRGELQTEGDQEGKGGALAEGAPASKTA